MYRSVFILYLLIFSATFAHSRTGDALDWHELPLNDAPYLLLAFEESPHFREALGHWSPLRFYEFRSQPVGSIRWALRETTRSEEGKRITIRLLLRDDTNDRQEYLLTYWTLENAESTVEVSVDARPNEAFIHLHEVEVDNLRRIWIRGFSSVEEAMETVSVSRASPGWRWRVIPF